MKSKNTGGPHKQASKSIAKSKSAGHGPATKNVATGARSRPTPKGPTGALKGSNRGGV